MKKKILYTTFLMLFFSTIAKLLSFMVRIYLGRKLDSEAMNLYTLAMPTLVFLIALSQLGLPTLITKLCAQSKQPKYYLKLAIILSAILNLLSFICFYLIIPYLSSIIFNSNKYLVLFKVMLPFIPAVALSGILKGYLLGIQKHIQANIAQVFEELFRLLFLYLCFNTNLASNPSNLASVAIFSITIGEIASSGYMIFQLKVKKSSESIIKQPINDLKMMFLNSLWISAPRFIGTITAFLEPILMLIFVSSFQKQMVNTYAILNGYLFPLLTMPSFLSLTLNNFLLPSFSYHYVRHHEQYAKRIFNYILSLCFLIGLSTSIITYFFAKEILELLYHQSNGYLLLKQLSFPFAFYSIQPILSSILHALNCSKQAMYHSLFGSILRLAIVMLAPLFIFDYAIPLAIVSGMLLTTFLQANSLRKILA